MGDGDDGDDVLVDENHLDLLMVRVQWGENTDGALVHLRQTQIQIQMQIQMQIQIQIQI